MALNIKELSAIETRPLTLEEFGHFKARMQHVLNNVPESIDARFLPTMKLLARMHDIATVWSCSGHTTGEYAAQGYTADDCGYFDSDKFYFTAVCRPGDVTQSEAQLRSILEAMVRDYSGKGSLSDSIKVFTEDIVLLSAFRFREDSYMSMCFEIRFANTKSNHCNLAIIVNDLNQRLLKAVEEQEDI